MKTKLDLTKYDFSMLPKVEAVRTFDNQVIVTFNRCFDNVEEGELISPIGDEFNYFDVEDVITGNVLIFGLDCHLKVGDYAIFCSDVIKIVKDEDVFYVADTSLPYKKYLVDRFNELYPKKEEIKPKYNVHEDVIDFFSKKTPEEQIKFIKAFKDAEVLVNDFSTTFKNANLDKMFDSKKWNKYFEDAFGSLKF